MPERAERELREARELLGEVKDQSQTIIRALRRYRWFLALTVLLVLAVGVLGWSTYKTSQCNIHWANTYTARTTTLTDLSTPRSDANAKLLRDVFTPGITKAEIIADGAAFTRADKAYKKALKDHPIPPSPTNHCSVF